MAKKARKSTRPRRKTNSTKAVGEDPKAALGPQPENRLDLAYWPEIPKEHRPREIVFDVLHEEDFAELEARGYGVILLRRLPVTEDVDIIQFNRYMLRAVIDGTISLSKAQAEALELDMKHRQMLIKTSMKIGKSAKRTKELAEIFDWEKSRHTADNTTVVDPKDMQKLLSKLDTTGEGH